MQSIELGTDDRYPGEGVSLGLARGLLVRADGKDLIREGMGIGSPALKTTWRTFFSRRYETEASGDRIVRTYAIDTEMLWSRNGRVSPFYTCCAEALSILYMRYRWMQASVNAIPEIRRSCRMDPVFAGIPPVAKARFEYTLRPGGVDVDCRIRALQGTLPKIFLLNEVSADAFSAGRRAGKAVSPPMGWELLEAPSALYDPVRGLTFSVDSVSAGDGASTRLFWGRERTDEICWAGFEIELDPGRATDVSCSYRVDFDGARVIPWNGT